MKTNSAFQVLLGLGCVGAAIAANVFWPFAHDSYLVAIFAGITVSESASFVESEENWKCLFTFSVCQALPGTCF